MFDDVFELDINEDNENDGDNNITATWVTQFLRRADLMAVALIELDDDSERSEVMAASLGVIDGDEQSGSG